MTSAVAATRAAMTICVEFAVKVLFTGTSLGVEGEGTSILRKTNESRKALPARHPERSEGSLSLRRF